MNLEGWRLAISTRKLRLVVGDSINPLDFNLLHSQGKIHDKQRTARIGRNNRWSGFLGGCVLPDVGIIDMIPYMRNEKRDEFR